MLQESRLSPAFYNGEDFSGTLPALDSTAASLLSGWVHQCAVMFLLLTLPLHREVTSSGTGIGGCLKKTDITMRSFWLQDLPVVNVFFNGKELNRAVNAIEAVAYAIAIKAGIMSETEVHLQTIGMKNLSWVCVLV